MQERFRVAAEPGMWAAILDAPPVHCAQPLLEVRRPHLARPLPLISYLRWLAVEEATFGSLLGRVLPLQIAGDSENPFATHSTTTRQS
jgi:hypothetical protein